MSNIWTYNQDCLELEQVAQRAQQAIRVVGLDYDVITDTYEYNICTLVPSTPAQYEVLGRGKEQALAQLKKKHNL